MTYEEFKTKYEELISLSLKYSLKQSGSGHYLEKASALDDAFPDYANRYMEES